MRNASCQQRQRCHWASLLCADGHLGQCQQDGSVPAGAGTGFGMGACTAVSVGKTTPLTQLGLRGHCLLEVSVYLMVTLQDMIAKEAKCISKSVPQSLLHGDAAGLEPAPLTGVAGREELPPTPCSLLLLRFSPWHQINAHLCANAAWRESFIATIVTLFCKFSFAESRYSTPAEWELCLVTSQLTLVPSVFSLLKYNALNLIKNFTSLIVSLTACCPVSYWVLRSSTFCTMEIPLSVKLELGSSLSRTIVFEKTDVERKYSVKTPAFVPVAVLKRSLFNSKTSFWQLHMQFFKQILLLLCISNRMSVSCFQRVCGGPWLISPTVAVVGRHRSSCCRQFLCWPLFPALVLNGPNKGVNC